MSDFERKEEHKVERKEEPKKEQIPEREVEEETVSEYAETVNKVADKAQFAASKISKASSKFRHARKSITQGVIIGGLGDRIVERIEDIQKLSSVVQSRSSGESRLLGKIRPQTQNQTYDNQPRERPRLFTGRFLEGFLGPSEEEIKAEKEALERQRIEAERIRLEEEEKVKAKKKKDTLWGQQGMKGRMSINLT